MATVFTNNIARQGRIFAGVLILLWIVVVSFVGFRFWLFMDEDFLAPSPEHLLLFDDIFFVVTAVITLLIGVIGWIVARLYTSLRDSAIRIEEEHKSSLMQEQEKIRIKRQLTNNINHELKTPICSILGYLEMVLGNESLDCATIRTFVQKSYDQAERLRRLMADLSTITRIDEASSMVECETIDLKRLIENVIDDTMPQAEHQSIIVENKVGDRKVEVFGNQMLLYSIFRNLIDNAIAYSGGRHVYVELKGVSDTHYSFSLRDNGIGVEAKHLPYLFERFYRVDKGRSRKLGGTGLGLSIVKNAVIFHGGTIVAKPSPAGGLQFDFTLRIKPSKSEAVEEAEANM